MAVGDWSGGIGSPRGPDRGTRFKRLSKSFRRLGVKGCAIDPQQFEKFRVVELP